MPPTSTADCSRFGQVLEAVGRSAAGDSRETAAAFRGRIVLDCQLEQAAQAASPTHETLAELYVEASQRLPLPAPADFTAVADELGLQPGSTAADLGRARRAFALANHPDRVPATEREQATRRMAVANILVDRALRASRNRE